MTILVHKTHIKKSHPLWEECDFLCLVSKNLYNTCLFQIRQYGFLQDTHGFSPSNDIVLMRNQKKHDLKNNQDNNQNKPLFFNQDFLLEITSYKDKDGNDKTKKHYAFEATSLYHCVKHLPEFRTNTHDQYNKRTVNTKILKQTLRQVQQDMSNFFASQKAYKDNPQDFLGKPKMPSYKTKGDQGRTVCTIPLEAISVHQKNNVLKFGSTNIALELSNLKDKDGNALSKDNILEAKIVPSNVGYNILISYLDRNTNKKDYKNLKNTKKQEKFAHIQSKDINSQKTSIRKTAKEMNNNIIVTLQEKAAQQNKPLLVAGCDVGVNNIASLASNDPHIAPMVINGRAIKSINQFYNKSLAHEQSVLAQNSHNTQFTSNKIKRLTQKRHHQMSNELHHVSKLIVNWLVSNGISCLVVGKNDNWKQEVNMGSKNNQQFVGIPHAKLIDMIRYKCERVGIVVLETEESYTSKCSFLDQETLRSHAHKEINELGQEVITSNYVGKRVKRGLFRSKDNILINADINASLNIIRKVFGDEFVYHNMDFDQIVACAVMPVRVHTSV